MGILDDAIREHLELRRRHGADAAEVERLEHSLLSEGEEAEPAAAPEPEAPAAEPAPAAAELEPEPEPVAAAESAPADPEPEPPFELAPVEQPTRQFTAAEREAAEQPGTQGDDGERDELEETPDFLQETPEHDRLWFEQKPPKDFDF